MIKQPPLVSVIMSVYNNSNTVEYSLNSILTQTYKNVEILVIDDASTDDTMSKLNSFESKNIKIFQNKENIGLTRSLNFLIKQSSGKYIARQDADDMSMPDRLSHQVSLLETRDYKICTTRALSIQDNKKIPGKTIYFPNKFTIKFKNPFIHGTLMIEKSYMKKVGYYDENFYYAQDYKLFSDLLKMNLKIYNSKKILYLLNMQNNISTEFKKEQQYFARCVRKNLVPIR